MSEKSYLKRLFNAYYKEKLSEIPSISNFEKREFGFIPWEGHFMHRHIGFENPEQLRKYLIKDTPKHAYTSGSLYMDPSNMNMEDKKYVGCDLIIDIDVDHFYTPCKEDHDLWYCKECGESGAGMPSKCPKCKSTKFKTLNWICEDCLEIAKNEIKKLIFDFLIPDFGIKQEEMKVTFSGHRGYHLKIENKRIRTLSSEERREIVDYLTGDNISFEVLGLRKFGTNFYGFIEDTIGWSRKLLLKIKKLLNTLSDDELKDLLIEFGLNINIVNSFINERDEFLNTINKKRSLWIIPNFGLKTWKTFLKGIVNKVGANIDIPVTIDIHRLIRCPGSLHGSTGFKAQELDLECIENFNPLNESNENLNPIVFKSEKTQKVEITEPIVPSTSLLGESFPSYNKGQIIEVPNHFAVFLLCKNVAKIP
jgi:DNA primase small subunit